EDQALCDQYFPQEALLQRARALAQENKNVESAKAYEEYLAEVPSADPQVKLEYAEQLTYARREGEAIPIFQELIKSGDNSDRVKRGLALALSWSGRCGEDQALCDQYFPQEALLQRARALAQANKNVESAQVYGEYLLKNPSAPPEVDLEHAEQLTYAHREGEAIPIFQKLIKGGNDSDRVKRGLALALLWSGRCSEDQALCNHYFPEEALQGRVPTLAQESKHVESANENPTCACPVLVGLLEEARGAAQRNENAKSAELFSRYMDQLTVHGRQVKREYADQLTYSKHEAAAIAIYEELLKDPKLEKDERRQVMLGLALAWRWEGKFDRARTLYREVLRQNPQDEGAKRGLEDADLDEARHAAAHDLNAESAALFGHFIERYPHRRLEVLREYGDQLVFSQRAHCAIPLFQELLEQPLEEKERRFVWLSLGLAYRFSEQYGFAYCVYEHLLKINCRDAAALVGRGSCFQHWEMLDEAACDFNAAVCSDPQLKEAKVDLARVESWRRRYRRARGLARCVLQEHPEDQDAIEINALNEQEMGLGDCGMGPVIRFLRCHPENKRMRHLAAQMHYWNAPETNIFFDNTQRSNQTLVAHLAYSQGNTFCWGRTLLQGVMDCYWYRDIDLNPTKADLFQPALFGHHQFNSTWALTGWGGIDIIRCSGDFPSFVIPVYDIWATYSPIDWFTAWFGSRHRVYDDITSISEGTTFTTLSASVAQYLSEPLKLGFSAEQQWVSDGNRGFQGIALLERRFSKSPYVFFGLRYKNLGFRKQPKGAGYFDPSAFHQTVATARIYGNIEEKIYYNFSGSYGYQVEKPGGGRGTWDVNLSATWEVTCRLLVTVFFGHFSSDQTINNGFASTTAGGNIKWRW
ncbi:MAG: hypothetical protein JSR80_00395, partial [Verrucomicrobia bacterium]|nr:hypothetical protein [Verrucomicrobiota bacterium]